MIRHLRFRGFWVPGLPGRAVGLLVVSLSACIAGCEVASDSASDVDAPPDSSSLATSPAAGRGAEYDRATPVVLVDSTIPPAVAGADGWMYSQSSEADLDGDGQAERVVLTARAEVMRGRPLWDDGQPWQVYVEEPDGARTYLYSRFVQLGSVTIRLGLPEGGQGPSVLLLEHLPDRMALYEAEYRGAGDASVVSRFERSLDPRGEGTTPLPP
jgi:hypothetical protein